MKKWHRLSALAETIGITLSIERNLDCGKVLAELLVRYIDPEITYPSPGRVAVHGVSLNREKFSRAVLQWLESRNALDETTFREAIRTNCLVCARREEKRFAAGTEKRTRLSWTDALVLGNSTSAIFYRSPEWRDIRYQALELYGNRCFACGRGPKDGGVIVHVDHVKPRSIYPELALDIKNLQILCEDCNLGKMDRSSTDWRRRIHA